MRELTLTGISSNMVLMSLLAHLFLPHHSNNQRARLLHPSSVAVIISLFVVVQLAISQISYRYPRILGYASQIQPAQILQLTNTQRQSNHLPSLTLDNQLSQAAAQKAADMFARDYWAHVSPTGREPWAFITESGYTYRYAGENLARDFADPQSVIQAWMNSSTHRENLLSNRYQDMGVAVVDGTLGGRDTTLVVQMFGTRVSSLGATSGGSTLVAKAQEAPSPAPSLPAANSSSGLTALTLSAGPQIPLSSPFQATKILTLSVFTLFVGVLLLDLIIVNRRKLIRWTSKSFAHFIFLSILVVAAATILRGQII